MTELSSPISGPWKAEGDTLVCVNRGRRNGIVLDFPLRNIEFTGTLTVDGTLTLDTHPQDNDVFGITAHMEWTGESLVGVNTDYGDPGMKVLLYGEPPQPGSGSWCYHETLLEMGHEVVHVSSWEGMDHYWTSPPWRVWWRLTRRVLESHMGKNGDDRRLGKRGHGQRQIAIEGSSRCVEFPRSSNGIASL